MFASEQQHQLNPEGKAVPATALKQKRAQESMKQLTIDWQALEMAFEE
jgi:hypothetical protein